MAPKHLLSSRTKPKVGEGRMPKSLGAASNADKKTTFKSQAPRDSKQSAQLLDTGSGTGVKGITHQGDELTIPDMFKNPQPTTYLPPSVGKMTMSVNLMQAQEAAEREAHNDGLTPLVSSNSFSQDTVDRNECCLDMAISSMDLALTGSSVSAPSSNCEGLLTVAGDTENYPPKDSSLGGATMPVQGFENLRFNNRVGLAHSFVSENLGTPGSTHAVPPIVELRMLLLDKPRSQRTFSHYQTNLGIRRI
ncbi:hypothetical protein NDU88_006991 [Pleurodeles waltl]|uniref:Uncharacterized protein n=1 Tax=Pleurodeles waltl TaxID=8319 RepID=A0AAV7RR21_PLEWA|nr:hypothetical protein NDU88_006991 [Pleurodeles waltl]